MTRGITDADRERIERYLASHRWYRNPDDLVPDDADDSTHSDDADT